MSQVCRVCGCSGDFEIYEAREMFYGTGEKFDYFQCAKCGCLQIREIPDDLGRFYPDDYYSKNVDYEEMIKDKKIKRFIGLLRRYLSDPQGSRISLKDKDLNIITHMRMRRSDRILDVGCGSGRLLYIMKEAGFENVFGADPFIDGDLEYRNGLKIYKKTVDQMEGESNWDFIMFHHSFEHVTHPVDVLMAAKRLLKEEGRIIIRIPVVGYAWEKYVVDWYQLDAPRHLYLHSKGSMRHMADKVGLEIDEIRYDSTASQFMISEYYQQGIPLIEQVGKPAGFAYLAQKYRKWKYKRMSRILNANMNGDQAAFILSSA